MPIWIALSLEPHPKACQTGVKYSKCRMTCSWDHWNTQAFPPRQGGDPWKGHSLSIHSLSNAHTHTHTHTNIPSLFNTYTHTCTQEIDRKCEALIYIYLHLY